MSGSFSANFQKSKYENFFDFVYISNRSAQVMNEDFFANILKPQSHYSNNDMHAMVAIESAKFFVPLAKKEQKSEYVVKVKEYAQKHQLNCIPGKFV